jgi:DNA ligase (NAD+)
VLDGRTFCITGSHSKPRKEIALAIKNAGGKVVSSVSINLDILVAGESAGSKLAKAEILEIEIWDEQKLFLEIASDETKANSRTTLFDY